MLVNCYQTNRAVYYRYKMFYDMLFGINLVFHPIVFPRSIRRAKRAKKRTNEIDKLLRRFEEDLPHDAFYTRFRMEEGDSILQGLANPLLRDLYVKPLILLKAMNDVVWLLNKDEQESRPPAFVASILYALHPPYTLKWMKENTVISGQLRYSMHWWSVWMNGNFAHIEALRFLYLTDYITKETYNGCLEEVSRLDRTGPVLELSTFNINVLDKSQGDGFQYIDNQGSEHHMIPGYEQTFGKVLFTQPL